MSIFSSPLPTSSRFAVRSGFLAEYPLRTVGARRHQEYWIPAEHLEALNASLVGLIEVVGEYRRME